MTQQHESDISSRVSSIEATISAIATEWRTERAAIRSDIAEIRDLVTNSRGIDWGAISVGVTVFALAATLVWTLISGVTAKLDDHVKLEGHPETRIATATLAARADAAAAGIASFQSSLASVEARQHGMESTLMRLDALFELQRKER